MRDSDESLLKSFAANRDEAAFRTLADRYLGLIFHTALRRTGSRPLAEEVSQNILTALVKKASSLAKNPDLLPAWLHRATLYESSKAMRSESSHQRRKQLQHPDAIPPTAGQASPWSDAVPHLDMALDKLPESDRGILMLHYFENRSFPTIARSLGKNPAAIQKQAQRALEKLARLLRSRGVALSVTAVAAGLTSEFAKAAPVAFLQSATATYSTTGLTLMTLSKSKALIPLALLLCAVPLVLQQLAISNIQAHNAALRANLQAGDRDTPTARLASVRKSGLSTNLDILVLYDEQRLATRQGNPTRDAFADKLAALDPETLVRLIREGVALRVNRKSKGPLLDSLVAALGKKDPRLSVVSGTELVASNWGTARTFVGMAALGDHFSAWVENDAEGAKTWLEELERSGDYNDPRTLKGAFAITFRGRLVAAMIASRSPDLREYLLTRPENERSGLVGESIYSMSGLDRESATSGCAAAIPLIREFVGESQRDAVLARMVGNLGIDSLGNENSTLARFFEKAELTPAETEAIARASVQLTLESHRTPYDPAGDARVLAETEAFLRKVIPLQADRILGEVTAKDHQRELRDADNLIKRLQGMPEAPDDALIQSLTDNNLRSQLPEALKIAERIKEPSKRAATIDLLKQRR